MHGISEVVENSDQNGIVDKILNAVENWKLKSPSLQPLDLCSSQSSTQILKNVIIEAKEYFKSPVKYESLDTIISPEINKETIKWESSIVESHQTQIIDDQKNFNDISEKGITLKEEVYNPNTLSISNYEDQLTFITEKSDKNK